MKNQKPLIILTFSLAFILPSSYGMKQQTSPRNNTFVNRIIKPTTIGAFTAAGAYVGFKIGEITTWAFLKRKHLDVFSTKGLTTLTIGLAAGIAIGTTIGQHIGKKIGNSIEQI